MFAAIQSENERLSLLTKVDTAIANLYLRCAPKQTQVLDEQGQDEENA